tara:strand:- start:18 stop:1127 length:1110 start_codon:yes stop_codon:yes gene_type:complete
MNKKFLKVVTPQGKYSIIIGHNTIANIGIYLKPILKNDRVFIITSKRIIKIYKKKLLNILNKNNINAELIIINDDEKQKNFNTISKISNTLLKKGIDRNDSLIAFGGGVIGDIAGFVSSITLRGIRFIQIPTTLLAQVDSSVGGKTGINTSQGKNLIGTFFQPKVVIIDTDFLSSLPKRELLSGYAEIIKYGLIMDYAFFKWLELNGRKIISLNKRILIRSIYNSCRNKAKIVNKDEKEKNVRALLNLGHTFGHAIESINKYKKNINHGEAVSIGIVFALKLSQELNHLSSKSVDKTIDHLKNVGLPTTLPPSFKRKTSLKQFLSAMQKDKKVKKGKINLVLLKKIGKAFVTNKFSEEKLNKVILSQIK